MNLFIKQNWFKLSVVTILLMFALSSIYYFSVYLPNTHNKEYSFQQEEKCKSLSDNFLKNHVEKQEYSNDSFVVESNSHFNAKLNNCLLYYHQRVNLSETLDNSYVLNALTGDVLIETHLRDNKEVLGHTGITKDGAITLSDFLKQEGKLMSE